MTFQKLFMIVLLAGVFSACATGEAAKDSPVPPPVAAPSEMPMATPVPEPKNGEYPGKGKVTKINMDLGTVELDHEEIKGVMPAMKMEFNVSDKTMLKDLKVGDKIDFTLEYKDRRETIVKIARSK